MVDVVTSGIGMSSLVLVWERSPAGLSGLVSAIFDAMRRRRRVDGVRWIEDRVRLV